MALNARRAKQLLEISAPLLLQGEQVELTSLAGIGTVSVRKQALTAAVMCTQRGNGDGDGHPRPMSAS